MSTRTSALDALVFGVDVQSGDVRGDRPSYALVVVDGRPSDDGDAAADGGDPAGADGVSVERDVVSRRKLLRLVERDEPAIVATDNVYELAEDKDALVHLLGGLPDGTRLVQVTGAERPEPLSRVASRHGVPYGKEPMQEAEAAARLAATNVGQAVSAFTEETEVKVSRGRSTGKGGWSEDRYTRRIHGNVRRVAREVERDLDDAALDYEREVTEKYGGFANAVFTVEARPEDIPVSTRRSGDVRVAVNRVRRDGIEFRPLAKRRDHVVVGVDPGTTTAVAVTDLDGHVLDVHSTRTADTAAVIEWIIERGRPVVVAADVTPMPETVEKIRRSVDAAGWTPESDLPVDGKQHRTREEAYDNDHERDALAAALYAFDAHEDQFRRIARKVPPRLDRGEVTARVVAGEESVEAVLADLTGEDDGDDEETAEHVPREPSPEEQRIRRLETQVERLEDHVADLRERLDEKDERIEEYEAELSAARRQERTEARERREVARLERKNSRLERERDEQAERADALAEKLERLKALWKLDHDDFSEVAAGRDLVPVKVVEQFTVDAIEYAHEQFGLAPGDVVLLRDASGAGRRTAELLVDFEPRVVLVEHGGLSEIADAVLFEADVPVGPAEDVAMQEVDELAVARESDVDDVVADWHDRAEERIRQQNAEMVDRLISEHRADRDRSQWGDVSSAGN